MARTLNLAEHTVKKEAFVEAALRLMQTKGWEQTSIQDVLDAVEASRGGFYHYFDSKRELLEAVIERIVEVGLGVVAPIVEQTDLSAPQKLERLFGGIARWKTQQKALVLALLQVWISDDNAIVREKFRHRLAGRMVPMLTRVIQQGVDEGTFSTNSANETARILVMLLLGFQDAATDLFIARQEDAVSYEAVERAVSSYTEAFERILGARSGSISIVDEAVMREWFG